MNKNDYINALDEIKASESLKKKTLYKVKEKRHVTTIPYKLVNAMAIILVLFSVIALTDKQKMNEIAPSVQEEEIIKKLPTVDNLQNLFTILGADLNKSSEYRYDDSVSDTLNTLEVSEKQYSETNIQEENVDEADIVKTDGNYIYYLSDQKLSVISENNNSKISEVKYSNEEKFYPSELYLYQNKLVVIGQISEYDPNMTVCYDLLYAPKGTTKAIVYNLMDKTNLKVEREIELDGNYLDSRMIGEYVYIITNQPIYINNEEEIDADKYKPTYKDTAQKDNYRKVEFEDIQYFEGSKENSYLNVMAFSVNTKREAKVESFLGAGNTVYVSENNIYITKTIWEQEDEIDTSNTEIIKLNIDKMKIQYISKAKIEGTIKNQFSLNEYNGNLRVATTITGYSTKTYEIEKLQNNLYILNENLEQIGKLENLAENESIRSVRYMGDKAYIVTFENTDPLFVIDTSDPTNPEVLGELKLPGYSEYLQFWDETHIIGIGYDADLKGNITGMKMSLFDISDSKNPKEVSNVKLGDKGTYTEAIYNHKVLLISKKENIIAFPIFIEEKSKDTFQGAIVYTVDVTKGFNEKGRIAHVSVNDTSPDVYKKQIERIIFIGNKFYTLSPELVKVTDRTTMQNISEIEL